MSLSIALMMFAMTYLFHSRKQAREPVWAEGERAVVHPREKLPLSVFVDESFGHHKISATKAMADLNQATCQIVGKTSEQSRADIHIRHEPCSKRNTDHPACTWLDPSTGQIIIQVGRPADTTTSYLIFFHELTHAFGLAHDGTYPVPRDSANTQVFIPITASNAPAHAYRLSLGLYIPMLSDKDTAAMKRRYCPDY